MALCALSLVVGCDPGSCQGAVDNDPNTDGIQGAPDVDDQVLVVPLCEGQNDQVIGDVDISTRAELEALANCRIVQGSVSYTHLDVYKRQVLFFLEFLATSRPRWDAPSARFCRPTRSGASQRGKCPVCNLSLIHI